MFDFNLIQSVRKCFLFKLAMKLLNSFVIGTLIIPTYHTKLFVFFSKMAFNAQIVDCEIQILIRKRFFKCILQLLELKK